MAVSLDVLSQTIASVSDEVTMALTQTTPFIQYSKKLGKIHEFGGDITGGSYQLRIPVEVQPGTTVTNLSNGYEQINLTQTNTTSWAQYTWGRKVFPFSISGREEAENMGEAAVVKLADTRYRSALGLFMRQINKQFVVGAQTDYTDIGTLNGTSTGDATGGFLENAAVASQNNSPGGLSRATYNIPGWTNQYNAGGANSAAWFATNGLQAMRNIRTRASLNRQEATDDASFHLILTTANLKDLYESSLYANTRYINSKDLDGSRWVLAFEDAPVIADPNMTAATSGTYSASDISAYFLNLDGIQLAIHRDGDFKVSEFIRTPSQDVTTAHIIFMGGLIGKNFGMQGLLMDAER
jgi:hypothetical protein